MKFGYFKEIRMKNIKTADLNIFINTADLRKNI